jgi:hypothetical protein
MKPSPCWRSRLWSRPRWRPPRPVARGSVWAGFAPPVRLVDQVKEAEGATGG